MNFLRHRELALAATGSTVAAHGAMLPDLWRLADRRVRVRAAPADSKDLAGAARDASDTEAALDLVLGGSARAQPSPTTRTP